MERGGGGEEEEGEEGGCSMSSFFVKGALSRYSVIFCAILLWGKIMAAVRFSIVAVLRTIRLCVDDLCRLFSGPVRCCNFCGTRAGIDPASPAVVGARETGASCGPDQEN